jgi:hypothetical protein
MIRILRPVDDLVGTSLVARKLVSSFAAAGCVAISIIFPGTVAISEPGHGPAGDGISGPPPGDVSRLGNRGPLAKGDRLQPMPAAAREEDVVPNDAVQNAVVQNAVIQAKGDPSPVKADPAPLKDCDPDGAIAYWFEHGSEPACPGTAQDNSIEADRAYLVETASPGYTMTRQGPELAIGRLNPAFAHRLAAAIREARDAGLPGAGIFSAYRPPAFGVGGFSNKFNSLHSYGLAVDMSGIGGPGSNEAKSWHEIAAKHGVVCPYGWVNRAEWNHCQPTAVKVIMAQNPLRDTISAEGPVNLDSMFEAGTALIEASAGEGEGEANEQGKGGYHLAGASTRTVLCKKGCAAPHQAEKAAPAKVLTMHHRFKMHSSQQKA